MTATPDRPATTPEGAGLAALSEAAGRTEGPWRAAGTGVVGGDHWYVIADGEAAAWISANDGDDEGLREPTARFIAALVNAYRDGRLSERTEGAGEVALSEALCLSFDDWEHHDQTDDFPCSRCKRYAAAARHALPSAGRETAIRAVHDLEATSADPSVEEYVDAVLAALPTAGRVVEVELVAEQVEALAAKGFQTDSDTWVVEFRHLRALAAAIRADGSPES